MNEFYLDKMTLEMRPFSMVHRFSVNGKISGSVAALMEMENTAVILYGPKGCGFHYRYTTRNRFAPFYDLECADFKNKDVVFGAEEKLTKLIKKIDQQQQPDMIFVLPTVVSDVINDDVKGICDALQPDVQAKIVVVKSQVFSHMNKRNFSKNIQEKANQGAKAKFSGSATYAGCGYVEVMDSIVQQLMLPQDKEPLSVNIESFIWGYGGAGKLNSIQTMLNKMGISVNTVLPATDIKHMIQAPRATLNIVRRKKWAMTMQTQFGTDYLHFADMQDWHGVQGIRDFYLAIGDKLGISQQVEHVLNEEFAQVESIYKSLRQYFSTKKVCLITYGPMSACHQLLAYQQDYGFDVQKLGIIISGNFSGEAGISQETLDKLFAKVDEVKQLVGSQAEVLLNPNMDELKKTTQDCDCIICDSNPRYSKLGKPILPTFVDRTVFDFASLVDVMEEMKTIIDRAEPQKSSLLLNRLEYHDVYFPLMQDDANTLASREMHAKMWRLRKV